MLKNKIAEVVMGKIVRNNLSRDRELAILAACEDLAEELMLVEPSDYICLLQTGNLVTLADLVTSSIEPFFDEKALTFACSGGYDLSWGRRPTVSLDFEFLHDGIFAFFRMILSHAGADVELNHISFDQIGQSPTANTEHLRQALDTARLRKQVR